MPVGDFLDTNVLIYAATPESEHARTADALITSGAVVSVQVLNEFANVMSRKYQLSWPAIRTFLDGVRLALTVVPLNEATHVAAIRWAERHKLQ